MPAVCWYSRHGGCKKMKGNCGYWHPQFVLCTHWQQGACKYGASCRLLHQTAATAENEEQVARAEFEMEEHNVAKLIQHLNLALTAKAGQQKKTAMVAAALIVIAMNPLTSTGKGEGEGKGKGKGVPVNPLLLLHTHTGFDSAEESYQRANVATFELDQRELIVRLQRDENFLMSSFAALQRALRVEIGTERQQRESLRDELCTERQQRQEQHELLRADVEALRNALTQGAAAPPANPEELHGTATEQSAAAVPARRSWEPPAVQPHM